MTHVFGQRAQDAMERNGVRALTVLWAGTLLDLLRGVVVERWQGRSGHHPRFADDASGSSFRGMMIMNGLARDVRHGLRSLLRAPGFTIAAVLTIGLGIGANAAIFSVVRAVLLRPLPYADPQQLTLVWAELTRRGVKYFPTSPPDFLDYRQMSTQFQDFAGAWTYADALTSDGEPAQIRAGGVTTNFFSVLGVRPVLGRAFNDADGVVPPRPTQGAAAAPASAPARLNTAVILDNGFWRSRFGGRSDVIGRIVDLGSGPAEVVGVAPPDFELLMPAAAGMQSHVDMWTAARIDYVNANRNNVFLRVIGRLRPGATVPRAQQDMDRIAADLRQRFTIKETAGLALDVIPMHEDLVAPVRPILWALMGSVVFVLLIACANVANLLLVRSSARERELAVRAAVGGRRWRLIRQMLVESVLLSAAGSLLGIGLALAGVKLLRVLQPEQLPRVGAIGLDGWVLAYTGLAALACAALFGAAPALRASRADVAGVLREGGRTPGLSANRLLRSSVIVAEVALSLVLLIGAGLMMRTFVALQRVDPGFDAQGVLTLNAAPAGPRYRDPAVRAAFFTRVHDRLAGLPGVTAVTAANPLPLDGQYFNGRWGTLEAATDPQAFHQADYRAVKPGYFEALRTPLVEGRTFTEADEQTAAAVVVVDEKLAKIAFHGQSAVGQQILIRVTTPEAVPVQIIGVVRHQLQRSLTSEGPEAIYFTPGYAGSFGALRWIVRTTGDPLRLVQAAKQQVREVDPLLPIADVAPLTDLVNLAMAPTRFALTLIATFAVLALVLAAIGLYGVLAYVVKQRTSEIGVRMAFGAPESSILRLIVGQGLTLSLLGTGVGLLGAVALTRVMRSLLVGVSATDPLTYSAITILFLLVAGLASLLPALRAARLDPVLALRQE